MGIEDQARSVLRLLGDPHHAPVPEVTGVDSTRCPNCDGRVERLASPYCSEKCRDQAAFVRQFRAALASGSIMEAEKQIVFGERLWWLLGGGLPLRESQILESSRRQIIKLCMGLCDFCGAPMTKIENYGSGCNRPLHLRASCDDCSRTKSYTDAEFSRSAPVVRLLGDLSERVFAPNALRPCDDPISWDWRAYVAQRRS
ncbi:MAG TPA: hypothetical protein VK171_04990 [Fimbriimonas sp.]|nr:hypothetical protein [Fimbriimonas sp.]